MTVPFRLDPESPKRPAHQDPFLEFESERPSKALLGAQEGARLTPETPHVPDIPLALDRPPADRRESSAISPTVAFAVGVAGLVTAAVGYYQMGQVLADRSAPAAQSATVSGPPSRGASALPAVGRLEITSDPAGASVRVNGAAAGVTPLTLSDVKPGRHQIVLTRGNATVRRSVDVAAGGSAVVTAVLGSAPPARPATAAVSPPTSTASAAPANAGWVTFDSPIELRVLDRGRVRGSTASRLSLSEGTYELELVSDVYEIRQIVSARVGAGRGTRIPVSLPSGSLSINAIPWADVWVDGSPVGTTPLANLNLQVGTHKVLLRHPTLGERQQTVVVKAATPARVGITFGR